MKQRAKEITVKLTPRMIDGLNAACSFAESSVEGYEEWDWTPGQKDEFRAAAQAMRRIVQAQSRAWKLADIYDPQK